MCAWSPKDFQNAIYYFFQTSRNIIEMKHFVEATEMSLSGIFPWFCHFIRPLISVEMTVVSPNPKLSKLSKFY